MQSQKRTNVQPSSAPFGVCGILGGMIQFGLTLRVVERFGILVALTLLPTLMLSGSIALRPPQLPDCHPARHLRK